VKLIREHIIFEKFTKDSDPIKDMGIGVIALFKKKLQKDANTFDDIEYAYGQTIRQFQRKYPGVDWEKIFNELSEYTYVNETFTNDETDPIEDMGIGGYAYETLKRGAIIKAKRMGFAVTRNQSGRFTNWRSGVKLWPENLLLITGIYRFGENYKDIHFRKYTEREFDLIPIAIERMKNNNAIIFSGYAGRMIVSKKMFDYRFEIIESGF